MYGHAMKPAVLYHTDRATETRCEILQVAVDIASAEGLEGLSIGRLAAELRMSKTGIFAHFGSKEQLQLATTVETAKQIFLEQGGATSLEESAGCSRLKAMLEQAGSGTWRESYFEEVVSSAAASAEFDSRPGAVRDQIATLTKAWMVGLQEEVAFAQSKKEIQTTRQPRGVPIAGVSASSEEWVHTAPAGALLRFAVRVRGRCRSPDAVRRAHRDARVRRTPGVCHAVDVARTLGFRPPCSQSWQRPRSVVGTCASENHRTTSSSRPRCLPARSAARSFPRKPNSRSRRKTASTPADGTRYADSKPSSSSPLRLSRHSFGVASPSPASLAARTLPGLALPMAVGLGVWEFARAA